MESLKEKCKLEVIKLGILRTELPKSVAKEVEIMEEKVKSVFTGMFSYSEFFYRGTVEIAWVCGEC